MLAFNLPKKIESLLLLCVIIASLNVKVWAQTAMDAPTDLFEQARKAEYAENWERAVALYTQGETLFPVDLRFPLTLGDLYFDRELYSLAMEHYRRAKTIAPFDQSTLYKLSQTAGYMNRDVESAEYLETLLAIDPVDQRAITDLGWMYFKLHRLKEGAALLEDAMERYGKDDISFAMTLATIYSDMLRYEDSKTHYSTAVKGAEQGGDTLFVAVAHYNWAILESRFYNYAEAFKESEASLASFDRPSGRRVRGELSLRKLDFKAGIADYENAFEYDTSPLAKLTLAESFQIVGRLEEARVYAEDCLKAADHSWLRNYGMDVTAYKMNVHEILSKTYLGLAETEGFVVHASAVDHIKGVARRISFLFKGHVNRLLFKKYALISANAQKGPSLSETEPDALYLYKMVFEAYPQRAVSYINRAEQRELPLIPKAAPFYAYEKAALAIKGHGEERRTAVETLNAAIMSFDPTWEKDVLADTYLELAKMRDLDAAERLFALNQGVLRQNGVRLPVTFSINAEGKSAEKICKAVVKTGFAVQDASYNARYSLTISLNDGGAQCALFDQGRGRVVFNKAVPIPFPLTRTGLSEFSRALGEAFVAGKE
jgi:tetratricopeptide (TPR) repeat protein